MTINKAILIVLKGNQLLDATIAVSLAILISSAGVTHMHKILGPKVRVMATKAMAIRAMVIVMVVAVGRPMVGPMISRGIHLISLKGINQTHLVIMSIGLMRLRQKTEFRNCSL